ncbi:hypothetical protein B1748_18170 [Paenibacillus sp. MY03]|uniref:O-antigen ligase family protein n=1 Tax=Paenibacillus sp. MY03 TaxID=302980 RepID=UPI000B3C9CDC|nr:hypothetical protein [Paenibacillus sp. MY03]OUS75398.1 hypothetical protein B1748_18170 [Paenibacillus sp. MY03]
MSSLDSRRDGLRHAFLAGYLFVLLLLTVYQDFPLVKIIGEIGRTPIVLLFPVFLLCEIAMLAKHKRITNWTRFHTYMFGFILYLALVSLVYILVQYMGGAYSFGSENLLGKGVKVLIYFLLILLYVRHIQLVVAKIGKLGTVCGCFLAAVTSLLLIMSVELASMPNALTFLHSGDAPYWRVRLLTSESSTTGTIVVVYVAILAYLSRYWNKLARTLTIVYAASFFLFYLFVTGSKGFMIIVLLTAAVTMVKFLDFRKKRNFVLLVAALLIMYLFIANFSVGIIQSFQNDIENYTSSYTRMGTIVIALLTVLNHPFGVGTGAYPVYFNHYLEQSVNLMSSVYYKWFGVSQINVSELIQYSTSTKNLGVKSGFFQWFMFGGLLSVAFFYLVGRHMLLKVKTSSILFLALVFTLLSLLLVSLEIKYEIWLLFAFIGLLPGKDDQRSPFYNKPEALK